MKGLTQRFLSNSYLTAGRFFFWTKTTQKNFGILGRERGDQIGIHSNPVPYRMVNPLSSLKNKVCGGTPDFTETEKREDGGKRIEEKR